MARTKPEARKVQVNQSGPTSRPPPAGIQKNNILVSFCCSQCETKCEMRASRRRNKPWYKAGFCKKCFDKNKRAGTSVIPTPLASTKERQHTLREPPDLQWTAWTFTPPQPTTNVSSTVGGIARNASTAEEGSSDLSSVPDVVKSPSPVVSRPPVRIPANAVAAESPISTAQWKTLTDDEFEQKRTKDLVFTWARLTPRRATNSKEYHLKQKFDFLALERKLIKITTRNKVMKEEKQLLLDQIQSLLQQQVQPQVQNLEEQGKQSTLTADSDYPADTSTRSHDAHTLAMPSVASQNVLSYDEFMHKSADDLLHALVKPAHFNTEENDSDRLQQRVKLRIDSESAKSTEEDSEQQQAEIQSDTRVSLRRHEKLREKYRLVKKDKKTCETQIQQLQVQLQELQNKLEGEASAESSKTSRLHPTVDLASLELPQSQKRDVSTPKDTKALQQATMISGDQGQILMEVDENDRQLDGQLKARASTLAADVESLQSINERLTRDTSRLYTVNQSLDELNKQLLERIHALEQAL